MTLNVRRLLKSRGVHFVDSGRNTARDHVNVKCPFCGSADPSEHMGISEKTLAWGCWRNEQHRGDRRGLWYLVMYLLRIDKAEAKLLVDAGVSDESASDLRSRLDKIDEIEAGEKLVMVEWPSSMALSFGSGDARSHRAVKYLNRRKFGDYTTEVASRYKLHVGMSGKWLNRLIIPFFYKGRLVGVTGRDMTGKSDIRYLNDPPGKQTKQFVFNYDHASRSGPTIVLVEGPMDCMKLDVCRTAQIHVVAILGLSLTDGQMSLLMDLHSTHHKMVLVVDRDAHMRKSSLMDKLSIFSAEAFSIGDHYDVDDIGEMTIHQAKDLSQRLASL